MLRVRPMSVLVVGVKISFRFWFVFSRKMPGFARRPTVASPVGSSCEWSPPATCEPTGRFSQRGELSKDHGLLISIYSVIFVTPYSALKTFAWELGLIVMTMPQIIFFWANGTNHPSNIFITPFNSSFHEHSLNDTCIPFKVHFCNDRLITLQLVQRIVPSLRE
jgi:hypothetical protein